MSLIERGYRLTDEALAQRGDLGELDRVDG
jgi:hypothetical protein